MMWAPLHSDHALLYLAGMSSFLIAWIWIPYLGVRIALKRDRWLRLIPLEMMLVLLTAACWVMVSDGQR
jgi:hypothetical protein